MYSISPISFQKLLSFASFQSMKLCNNEPHYLSAGSISFSDKVDDSDLKENVGIYFFKQINEHTIEFEFVKMDSFYYNIGYCEIKTDPFKIRNFIFEEENITECNLMVITKEFIHFETDNDNFFIIKCSQPCHACKKTINVLDFNHQVYLCSSCMISFYERCCF